MNKFAKKKVLKNEEHSFVIDSKVEAFNILSKGRSFWYDHSDMTFKFGILFFTLN